jgi:hypothetical protein
MLEVNVIVVLLLPWFTRWNCPLYFFTFSVFYHGVKKKTNVCMIVFPIFFLSKFCMCIVADKERVAETNAEESAKKLLS